MLTVRSDSETLTGTLAAGLGRVVKAGDVVALNGELGAGKTCFVRAFATSLGCEEASVNSPTFGLVQHYEGRMPIVHIDAYRLRDADEFEELGGRELFIHDGVTLIEWADRIAECLPREYWDISASHVGESSRRFAFRSTHANAAERLKQLAAAAREVQAESSGN
jgi:tRNA threonylcarbamoyladenosine biosynthesis protein TsaE